MVEEISPPLGIRRVPRVQRGRKSQQPKLTKAQKKAKKQAEQAAQRQQGGPPAGNANQQGGQNSRKHILCNHVKDPAKYGPCQLGGGKCPYSHNKNKFDEKGKLLKPDPKKKAK